MRITLCEREQSVPERLLAKVFERARGFLRLFKSYSKLLVVVLAA
jgi:hypothetical protein